MDAAARHLRPTGGLYDARSKTTAQHNSELALHEYLVLHEQHESLRRHLDQLSQLRCPSGNGVSARPTYTLPGSRPPAAVSLSRADTNNDAFFEPSYSLSPQMPPPRRASLPSAGTSDMAVEEARLCDVNEGIKRTLTELLNSDAARGDHAFRTWVQCRLMDTEREMRSRRRRRSAPDS